jgi:hypothetical protein
MTPLPECSSRTLLVEISLTRSISFAPRANPFRSGPERMLGVSCYWESLSKRSHSREAGINPSTSRFQLAQWIPGFHGNGCI